MDARDDTRFRADRSCEARRHHRYDVVEEVRTWLTSFQKKKNADIQVIKRSVVATLKMNL